jgi:type I restriction enzyme S subunit
LAVESKAFKDFIQGFVTGAAQPQANATTMSLFPLYYPGKILLEQFNEIIQPLLDQKDLLLQQNRTLTKTRDLLLPRLISGKLPVEHLDIQTPPSMNP